MFCRQQRTFGSTKVVIQKFLLHCHQTQIHVCVVLMLIVFVLCAHWCCAFVSISQLFVLHKENNYMYMCIVLSSTK